VIAGPEEPAGPDVEGVEAEAAGAVGGAGPEEEVLLLIAEKELAFAPIGVEDAILDVNLPMILWPLEG